MRPKPVISALILGLTCVLAACSSSTGGAATPPSATAPGSIASTSRPLTTPTATAPTTSSPTTPSDTSAAPSTPPSTPPSTAPTSTAPATGTRTSVLRPVRADGTVVAGWTVHDESVGVRCSPGEASPAAVTAGIAYCSPSAAYAIACWQAADHAHALCLYDGTQHTLGRLPLDGSFGSVTAPHPSVPFDLELDNGVTCRIRDGGAASNLTQHPDWIPFYYCDHNLAVYGPPTGTGIDRSAATWRVQVGSTSGESDTATRQVVAARFVGTQGS